MPYGRRQHSEVRAAIRGSQSLAPCSALHGPPHLLPPPFPLLGRRDATLRLEDLQRNGLDDTQVRGGNTACSPCLLWGRAVGMLFCLSRALLLQLPSLLAGGRRRCTMSSIRGAVPCPGAAGNGGGRWGGRQPTHLVGRRRVPVNELHAGGPSVAMGHETLSPRCAACRASSGSQVWAGLRAQGQVHIWPAAGGRGHPRAGRVCEAECRRRLAAVASGIELPVLLACSRST